MATVEEAMEALRMFVHHLAAKADQDDAYAQKLWERICASPGVLRELAYFHDTGDFWGGYKISGITITDILVWQVDHFKAYMDREDMNRYRRERLFLESIEVMLDMEKDPEPFLRKMREESGQDRENP